MVCSSCIADEYHFVLCCEVYNDLSMEASVDPLNVAIMFKWSSCFMLTCRGITRHDDLNL